MSGFFMLKISIFFINLNVIPINKSKDFRLITEDFGF
jgi:hypothetical protein